jgi:mono/diheme cytochrome c family protein
MLHRTFSLALVLGSLLTLSTSAVQGTDVPITAKQTQFFEENIRPLLVQHCYACHGSEKQKNGLRVDSLEALLTGGDSGPAITLGKPDESLLIEAIEYNGFEMPPSAALPQQIVDDIRQWISDGAKWPTTTPDPSRDLALRFTDEDRDFWSFQEIKKPRPPRVRGNHRHPIDRFVTATLRDQGLSMAPPAQSNQLIRRLYLDLTGLIPPPEVVEEFNADPSDEHYRQIVEQLLNDEQHGVRWAKFWLDLVRYADSDGYSADYYRNEAWRYRDYVIDSFNQNRPYDQFIRQQLAGDELEPENQQAQIATGFLRHWIYEYNQRDARSQWDIILNDITDVTGDAFLGLGISCARCHDHKFDPILQDDYYRLRAFFAPLLPLDEQLAGTPTERAVYQAALDKWHHATINVRQQIDSLQAQHIEKITTAQIEMFPLDVRPLLYKKGSERTPYEKQIAYLAFRQVQKKINDVDWLKHFKETDLEDWKRLSVKLKSFDNLRPAPLGVIASVTDVDTTAPLTLNPNTSNPQQPGGLSLLDPTITVVSPLNHATTGRRTALANWLTDPQHPLTSRVMVNRIWQYHFGHGIVDTPSDFGTLGTRPTHPELLDFLAASFIESNWDIKELHRFIVTSQTYRQSAIHPQAIAMRQFDADNQFLWRANIRRLDAEQIRDNILNVSGELDMQLGGEGQDVESTRRSAYLKMMRNHPHPFLLAFDGTDGILSSPERNTTTTPTQTLLIMNNDWVLARATALSKLTLPPDMKNCEKNIDLIHWKLYSRCATDTEKQFARDFFSNAKSPEEAWTDYCHVLLAANEFLYIQ